MKIKLKVLLVGVTAMASLVSAETLTYNNAASGSFYDGSFWGGTVPSKTSDIVFTGAQTIKYTLDAKNGITVNSISDSAISDLSLWGRNIEIQIGSSTFTVLNDVTLTSNHNFSPFTFNSAGSGKGKVVIGGNLISKTTNAGASGESLWGTSTIESVSIGKNIELSGSKVRFRTLNVSVGGVVNYTGGELNLYYSGQSTITGITSTLSFGGINASNKSLFFGDDTDKGKLLDSTINVTLTNSASVTAQKFSGGLEYHQANNSGNNFNLIMDSADGNGVQYFELTKNGTKNSGFTNVTVKNGKLNYSSVYNTEAIAMHGGELSAATTSSEIAAINCASLAWSGGLISFDIAEDTNDKIVLSGNLTKEVLLGLPARQIELVADAQDIVAWIEASEEQKVTYTLMEYAAGSTIANPDVTFAAIDGVKIDYDFGNTALTVTLSKVPEPATVAVIFGAIGLAFAAYRRRK